MTTEMALEIESLLPATFTAPDSRNRTFSSYVKSFPDALLEYTGDSTVIVMPPTDPLTGQRIEHDGVHSCTADRDRNGGAADGVGQRERHRLRVALGAQIGSLDYEE